MTKRHKLMLGAAAVSLFAATAIASCAQQGGSNGVRVASGGAPAVDCRSLASTAFPDATITLAEAREPGSFTPPGGGGPGGGAMELPAFCRVAATLTPSADSNIKTEVWLPTDWNGKFMMVGNGGWSGAISYSAMAEPLRRGYAVASTDTGHEGSRGTFAFEHPEWFVDFAYRAVHETTVKGKALTEAYYGGGPQLSYWNGCSSGGKQGLREAQSFADDFDAMIVGAPANNWVRLQTQSIVAGAANLPAGRPPLLGQPQFSLLHDAVIAQCDALDGVADGEIADARVCNFEASSLVCEAGEDPAVCLTPDQAAAADKIYAPVRDPATDELIFPGMPPGSELLWAIVVSQPWMTGVDTFAVLLDDPDWDAASLNLSTDVIEAEENDIGLVTVDPDLSAFEAHGGKIIQYHGWTDALIPTENSINYYESVVAEQGGLEQTQEFYRLFLVPGMGHCNGAYAIDFIEALEQWVEAGEAPEALLGRKLLPGLPPDPPLGGAPDYGDRPICAYPNVAVYSGSGSDGDPANYSCQATERGARQSHRP